MARLAGKVEADAADRVVRLLAPHLDSGNRYVRGLTAVALRRLGTPAATELLLDWLSVARWCPITAPIPGPFCEGYGWLNLRLLCRIMCQIGNA